MDFGSISSFSSINFHLRDPLEFLLSKIHRSTFSHCHLMMIISVQYACAAFLSFNRDNICY